MKKLNKTSIWGIVVMAMVIVYNINVFATTSVGEKKVISHHQYRNCLENDKKKELSLSESLKTFNLAFKNGDVAILKNMITDIYVHTNGSSKAIHKKDWITYLIKRKEELDKGDLVVNSYEMKEVEFIPYNNDLAIITGKIVTNFTKFGKTTSKQYRVTHVWVKENGIWKRTAFQDHRIKN